MTPLEPLAYSAHMVGGGHARRESHFFIGRQLRYASDFFEVHSDRVISEIQNLHGGLLVEGLRLELIHIPLHQVNVESVEMLHHPRRGKISAMKERLHMPLSKQLERPPRRGAIVVCIR